MRVTESMPLSDDFAQKTIILRKDTSDFIERVAILEDRKPNEVIRRMLERRGFRYLEGGDKRR